MDTTEINQIAQKITRVIQDKLRELKIESSGNLINSVDTEILLDDKDYVVEISLADYWKFVDEGRHAGRFPPPQAIKDYIRFKPIVPRANSKGKIPSTEQLAYVIGRKISREGIKPKPFLNAALDSPAMDRILDEIADLVQKNFVEQLDEEIDKL